MTDTAKILPFLPRPPLPHHHSESPGPLAFNDGMCGLIFSPKAFQDAMESVVVSDALALEVPIWHWEEPTDRFCRIDAALRHTIRELHRAATGSYRAGVMEPAKDVGCRISYRDPDDDDYYYWAARVKADYDDPEACVWIDGKKFWESMQDEFETHLGYAWSEKQEDRLRERLAAASAFDTTFRLLESLMPSPFKTLDDFMMLQKEAGRAGDHDGRTFSRYLSDCVAVVKRPDYPAKSRTTFYRFLLAWAAARRCLGAHFRVVKWKDYSDDVERFIGWGTDISVVP
jgi:hypothetical protein